MPRLYEDVLKRLDVIESMYDAIRIVEPANKTVVCVKGAEISKLEGNCYDYLKGERCNNCISYRAYSEDVVVAKIESNCNKPIAVMAIPIKINEDTYVVELLKSIGKKDKIFESNNDNMIVKAELIELFNVFYQDEIKNINMEIENDFIEISDDKLLLLENKIDELRENLNHLCGLEDKIGREDEILMVSQDLDELIVEYMKIK